MEQGVKSFEFVYNRAMQAGADAALKACPQPMVVISQGGQRYHVSDGVCGFAWVRIKGNTPFGRWAKKTGHASSAYPSGLDFWISDYGQSMQRKEAHAHAMAKALRELGLEHAYAGSRMD